MSYKNQRGIASLIIALIVAGTALLGGGVYYGAVKSNEKKPSSITQKIVEKNSEQKINEISVSIPSLDLSKTSVISAISIPHLSIPETANFSLGSTKLDTTLSINTPKIELSAPNLTVDASAFQNKASASPANSSSSITPESPNSIEIPTRNEQPETNCALFEAIPSCEMAGQGTVMCKKCFPNK
jgi:hypothetical protein